MPRHVAIIMDGNGRWARQRGLPRLQGHNAGMTTLREIVRHTDELNIPHLTVYAFSTENWKRPQDEVSGIFKLLVLYVQKELRELHRNGVQIDIWGDLEALPADAKAAADHAMDTTKNNAGLRFNIALNYGGRAELLRAARDLANDVKQGILDPDDIDESAISRRLYSADSPDPDLIIRTGGEMRQSNFLIWQGAYSEWVVTDMLWPDFTPAALDDALSSYQTRQRRFGGIV